MKRILILLLLLTMAFPAFAEGTRHDWYQGETVCGYYQFESGVYRLYNLDGTLVTNYEWPAQFVNFQYFDPFEGYDENGLAQICLLVDEDGFLYNHDEDKSYCNYGLIDRSGNLLLEPIYDEILYTHDGVYRVTHGDDQHYYSMQANVFTEIASVSTSIDLDEYWPNEGSKVPVLDKPSTLRIADDLPRIDGATALVPLYSAVAQAVYPGNVRIGNEDRSVFTYSNTIGAYERLIDGRSDVIFVAQPSDKQLEAAKTAGVELELTPIGYEAFVFFVNRKNPMDSITVEQIRSIYSGAITEWDALGYEGLGEIVAYQRPENSGSQTALERLMGDTPIMEAPNDSISFLQAMNDIVNVVEYRNLPNAIGYSFRFFLTVMMNSDVKMLSINGIEPSEENIRNQTYPVIAKIYAVSRKGDDNPNLAALLEWLQGEQGMELVRKSGYIPYTIFVDGKIVENLIP